MIVKMEMSDGMSNHSDFSNDSSDNSQEGITVEFKIESGILIAPANVSFSGQVWLETKTNSTSILVGTCPKSTNIRMVL